MYTKITGGTSENYHDKIFKTSYLDFEKNSIKARDI